LQRADLFLNSNKPSLKWNRPFPSPSATIRLIRPDPRYFSCLKAHIHRTPMTWLPGITAV